VRFRWPWTALGPRTVAGTRLPALDTRNGSTTSAISVLPMRSPNSGMSTHRLSRRLGSQVKISLIAPVARMRCWLAPGPGRRQNLMEGHLAFSLFVNADWSLEATVVDSAGAWSGASSGPHVMPTGRWTTVEFAYDGVKHLQVLLDGVAVVDAYLDLGGPVQSVGPNGLAIGSWPDRAQYAFSGYVAESALYRYSPELAALAALDPCCADLSALDVIIGKLATSDGDLTALSLLRLAHPFEADRDRRRRQEEWELSVTLDAAGLGVGWS
jgi:hypothetical protein